MRLLLDTNVLIVLSRRQLHSLDARMTAAAVLSPENVSSAGKGYSAATEEGHKIPMLLVDP
jgi:hypothetical protein